MSTYTKPNQAGKKWSQLERSKLLVMVENGTSLEDIAKNLERSVGAVKSRLMKEAYDLITENGCTAEELFTKYNLPVSDILKYQEREDEKRNNPPIKRVTRSQTASEQDDNKRSFSAVTKTRQALNPTQNETVKPLDIQPIKAMTYEEKSLVLLTEVRDLLKVIAAKK